MKKKQQSPIAILLGLASDSKNKFVESVILAIIGVVAGVIPYLVGAKIIVALMSGNEDVKYYSGLCISALRSYISLMGKMSRDSELFLEPYKHVGEQFRQKSKAGMGKPKRMKARSRSIMWKETIKQSWTQSAEAAAYSKLLRIYKELNCQNSLCRLPGQSGQVGKRYGKSAEMSKQ